MSSISARFRSVPISAGCYHGFRGLSEAIFQRVSNVSMGTGERRKESFRRGDNAPLVKCVTFRFRHSPRDSQARNRNSKESEFEGELLRDESNDNKNQYQLNKY